MAVPKSPGRTEPPSSTIDRKWARGRELGRLGMTVSTLILKSKSLRGSQGSPLQGGESTYSTNARSIYKREHVAQASCYFSPSSRPVCKRCLCLPLLFSGERCIAYWTVSAPRPKSLHDSAGKQ